MIGIERSGNVSFPYLELLNFQKRVLKVIAKHRLRAYHKNIIVPEIRLVGKWPLTFRFKIEDNISKSGEK